MKYLSDYKGEEAIELWADLLEPLTVILGCPKIREVVQEMKSGKPKIILVKAILDNYSKEAIKIMQRIDPEPVDGMNIILRLLGLITDIGKNEEIQAFFGFAEQEKSDNKSFGSATESTEANES